MEQFYLTLAVLSTAFFSCYKLIPIVIQTAQEKSLFDIPDGRKQHVMPIPPLGGVAIFISMIIAFFLWSDLSGVYEAKYAFLGMIVLFFMGLKDDLVEMKALPKLFIQLSLAALVAFGGIRLSHLHGFLGMEELNIFFQYGLTILFIVGLTNAYNLIDGIDGLAGGIALIAAVGFGIMFAMLGVHTYSLAAFALAGSLLGFLKHNFSPASIFMGDTGSLTIGILLSILSIQLLETTTVLSGFTAVNNFFPVFVFAFLVIPIVDISQVMFVRILNGNSPFSPDREHTHHILLRLGFTHKQAAITLYLATLFFVGICLLGLWLGFSHTLTLIMGLVCMYGSIALIHHLDKKKQVDELRFSQVPNYTNMAS